MFAEKLEVEFFSRLFDSTSAGVFHSDSRTLRSTLSIQSIKRRDGWKISLNPFKNRDS